MKSLSFISLLIFSFSALSIERRSDVTTVVPVDIHCGENSQSGSFSVGGFMESGNVNNRRLTSRLSGSINRSAFTTSMGGSLLYGENGRVNKVYINKGSFFLREDIHFNDNWGLGVISTHGYFKNQNLDYRTVNGLGPKYTNNVGKLVFDVSFFAVHEHEDFTGGDRANAMRLSVRTYARFDLSNKSNITWDFYYIPKISDMSDDVRLIVDLALNTLIYKDWLWFSARHEVESDSRPRPGVEQIDRNTNFSFKVQF